MAVARNAPNPEADNALSGPPSRASQYSDTYVQSVFGSPHSRATADEGTYFTALNTTPGTGMAGNTAASNDATKPLIWLYNGGNYRIIVDTIVLRATAIGASGTTMDVAVFTDTGATRASGGTQVTPKNVNADSSRVSQAAVWFGAPVLVNANAVQVAHRRIRSVVPVVEDQYTITFGYGGYAMPAAVATTGTNILAAHVNLPPVVIGPGDSFIFVEWGTSHAAAHTWDIELNYIER